MFRRRDEGAAAAPPNVYQMHQRMFSIGDDFWIENGAGQRLFKVDGKALRVRKTLELQGPDGRALYTIKEKLVSVREVMTVEGPSGPVATVKKALISPLRERYDIELAAGGAWKAQGNIVDHQYEVEGPSGKVAEVSKRRCTRTWKWCSSSSPSGTRLELTRPGMVRLNLPIAALR